MAKRAPGEGQLRQRPNGLWELSVMIGYKDDGKRKTKSFYGKTQKEAKTKYEEYKHQKTLGLNPDYEPTFGEWADKWYENYKDSVSPSTYESYRYTLASLKEAFGNCKLKAIKPMDVENYLKNLRLEGKSDSMLTKCRGMLFQIMHKAEANDLVLKNPVRFADKMKRTRTAKTKDAFNIEEIKLLFEQLPENKIGNSIRLMIVTGMRSQEILALKAEHIEEDGSQIHIRQAVKMVKGTPYVGETKSTGSDRDIPVPENFRNIAVELRNEPGEFVWSGKIPGQPFNPRNFRKKFTDEVAKIEGVRPLTPHCCRHTYITWLQSLGVDTETIKSLAGHADTEMTEHYIHVQMETMKNATSKLNDLF